MAEQMWWYSKGGQNFGPETLAELHKLVSADTLQRHMLVWTDGMDEWLEAQHVKEFENLFKGPPPLPPFPSDSQATSENYDSANSDKDKTKMQLSEDVRKKYITTLFKVYSITGRTLGLIIGLIIPIIIMVNTEIRSFLLIFIPIWAYSIGADITDKIQKKMFTDKSDELIQVLYNEHIKKKGRQEIISSITGSIIVIFVISVLIFSEPTRKKAINLYENITSNTNCVQVSSSAYEDAFLIKRKSDYGYTVKVKIKNDGDAGEVSLVANLLTSEGDFSRKQKVHLKAGETHDLAFQFPEPTVNVTNVRYKLSCK